MIKNHPIMSGFLRGYVLATIIATITACVVPPTPVEPGQATMASANTYMVGSVGPVEDTSSLYAIVDPKTGATCYVNANVSAIFCLPKP